MEDKVGRRKEGRRGESDEQSLIHYSSNQHVHTQWTPATTIDGHTCLHSTG